MNKDVLTGAVSSGTGEGRNWIKKIPPVGIPSAEVRYPEKFFKKRAVQWVQRW